jgi:hypothetical protein
MSELPGWNARHLPAIKENDRIPREPQILYPSARAEMLAR